MDDLSKLPAGKLETMLTNLEAERKRRIEAKIAAGEAVRISAHILPDEKPNSAHSHSILRSMGGPSFLIS
jgi:hypothetical protein